MDWESIVNVREGRIKADDYRVPLKLRLGEPPMRLFRTRSHTTGRYRDCKGFGQAERHWRNVVRILRKLLKDGSLSG